MQRAAAMFDHDIKGTERLTQEMEEKLSSQESVATGQYHEAMEQQANI